jgi:hypothetical protein
MKEIITLEYMTIGPFILLVFPGISQRYAIRIGHHSALPGHEGEMVYSWDHRLGSYHVSRPIPLTGERTSVEVEIYLRGQGTFLHTARLTYSTERGGGELAREDESKDSLFSIAVRRRENHSICIQD